MNTPAEHVPPRERILAAARNLFYRHGIRAIGVDAIAGAAGTNKMTLYRHFPSKDELVAECLRRFAADAEGRWADLEAAHPGDARAQLRAWAKGASELLANAEARGCPLCNAAIELPEKDHPGRKVIEACKISQRNHLVRLCRAAGALRPEQLADELFLLLEGALVSVQSVGREGLGARFLRMAQAAIAEQMRRAS